MYSYSNRRLYSNSNLSDGSIIWPSLKCGNVERNLIWINFTCNLNTALLSSILTRAFLVFANGKETLTCTKNKIRIKKKILWCMVRWHLSRFYTDTDIHLICSWIERKQENTGNWSNCVSANTKKTSVCFCLCVHIGLCALRERDATSVRHFGTLQKHPNPEKQKNTTPAQPVVSKSNTQWGEIQLHISHFHKYKSVKCWHSI